mgnify:CR=1 FL=1
MQTKNNSSIPADGWAGLKQNFTQDALSGFLVFLLALPLSLGIAKASDFPAIFGIVTAIIGGVVVSFFAGSRLTIKGPAAGLIVIASGCVGAYGGGETGWHLTLGAIVVAGLVQVLFGVFKLGRFADFFPGAAIHGMLAAIGIIIMSKQIHTLLGINPKELSGKEPLELLAMIPSSIMHENAHLAEIGIACLLIMILFSFVRHRHLKKIPAPLVVLIIAIPLGLVLHVKTENGIANFSLVKIGNLMDAFSNGVINADFSGISTNTGLFIQYVILFSLIGSIESLLTAKAIDGMDPYHRKSDFNKDLVAVGIGNTLSGLLGGLPMISEVARSSANVGNGAKTRWANFFHGLFLLIAVLFAVPFIEMIPNAALAAMLIFVGFRLAHPKEFMHMWHLGKEQLFIFVVTIFMTLATDLLIGVGSGILLELLINALNGAPIRSLFKSDYTLEAAENGEHTLYIRNALLFSNNIMVKKELARIPRTENVCVDLSQAKLVDHSSLVLLSDLSLDFKNSGGLLISRGLDTHCQLGHDATSTYKLKGNRA